VAGTGTFGAQPTSRTRQSRITGRIPDYSHEIFFSRIHKKKDTTIQLRPIHIKDDRLCNQAVRRRIRLKIASPSMSVAAIQALITTIDAEVCFSAMPMNAQTKTAMEDIIVTFFNLIEAFYVFDLVE
jgi:hypothetical protein